MTRSPVAFYHACAEFLSFVPPHHSETVTVFDCDTMPRSQPGVVRFAEKHADLFGVRPLRMNGKPQRHRKAIVEQPSPAITSLNNTVRELFAIFSQLTSTLALVHRNTVLEQKPLNAVE